MDVIGLWPANTLPLPHASTLCHASGLGERPQEVDLQDLFPKGALYKYFPHQGYGFIKDRLGREVYFNLSEMVFVGRKGKEHLARGITIGYDLSHSGKGLRVKRMKIY